MSSGGNKALGSVSSTIHMVSGHLMGQIKYSHRFSSRNKQLKFEPGMGVLEDFHIDLDAQAILRRVGLIHHHHLYSSAMLLYRERGAQG